MRKVDKPIGKKSVRTAKKKSDTSSQSKISKQMKPLIERELDHLVLSPRVNVGKGRIDQKAVLEFFREFKAKQRTGIE